MAPSGRYVRSAVAARPVPAFVLIAVGWAWAWDVAVAFFLGPTPGVAATIPRTWGPIIGVAAVLHVGDGTPTGFLRSVIAIPERWWLLGLAAALPIALGELDVVLAVATGTPVTAPVHHPSRYVAGFLLVFLLAGGLEEFGWRAYLQPTLQDGAPAVLIALLIGALWATWHLPLFVLFDLQLYERSTLPLFYGVLMVESIVLAWLYNETGGSVLAPMAFHAAANLPALGEVGGSLPGLLEPVGRYGYALGLVGVALVVVRIRGWNLARTRLPSEFWSP